MTSFVTRFIPQSVERRNQFIWLTIYSDLITNLLLLFLSLYALSFMGPEAIADAASSMKHRLEYSKQASPWYEEIADELNLKATPGALVIAREDRLQMALPDEVLFDVGEADLKPGQHETLDQLVAAIEKVPYTILVEGHTDNQALRPGGRFHSNWELSMARAMSVVRYIVHRGGISPRRIGVAAFGEFHPRAPNDSPENQAMNRRIEVSILRYE